MKKLICCLLVVVMLFTAVSALAESKGRFEKNDALRKFWRETDKQTQDIALQISPPGFSLSGEGPGGFFVFFTSSCEILPLNWSAAACRAAFPLPFTLLQG